MHTVLIYADSLTWGIVPNTRKRLPFPQRWPGVLECSLKERELDVRIVENCLNGRRTAFDDPYKPGRNGVKGLGQVIEAQSPLDLVIVMLGTNDFQSMHPNNAWHSAQGLAAVITAIRQTPLEPDMPVPPILVVAPPQFDNPRGPIGPKFEGAQKAAHGLSEAYHGICDQMNCAFFDAAQVTGPSRVDGVHLDQDQHEILGHAIADPVATLLRQSD